MTYHTKMSVLKSLLRILGYAGLLIAAPDFMFPVAILVISEIAGLLEEIYP